MPTPLTKIPFGTQFRGKRMRDLPESALQWCATKLWDTDLHEWALLAKQVLQNRENDGDLETQADDFLRQHGYDPKHM